MAAKPFMTSDSLIAAVKRKIMLPLSQNTFTASDVLAFANEEMMISQVPSVLEYHQEYFVFKVLVPLVDNTSRYPIPTRAIGMRLRDVMWSDNMGNLFEMTRINPEEKYIFQQSTGTNQAIITYYLEGNDVVLTPGVTVAPTGSLALFFFIRPNQLVPDSRACIIQNYVKRIVVDGSELDTTDTLNVSYDLATSSPQNFVLAPSYKTITSNSVATETVITGSAHGITPGDDFTVYISEVSGSTPTISGVYVATAIDATSFSIPVNVTVGGTGGFYALEDEFSVGSTDIQTAANLALTLEEYCGLESNNNASATVQIDYSDITLVVTPTLVNATALVTDPDTLVVNFDQLPTSWTDPTTNVTDVMFIDGVKVDFLQTDPGHRTYTYDVTLVSASGTEGTFAKTDLQYYASTGTGQTLVYLPMKVGDYIGLANECIIPQIPPDLHNGLAERTSARILAAIGDQMGLDRVNLKIAEIDKRQGNLLDARIDGASQKVTSRHSPLGSFKRTNRRWGR